MQPSSLPARHDDPLIGCHWIYLHERIAQQGLKIAIRCFSENTKWTSYKKCYDLATLPVLYGRVKALISSLVLDINLFIYEQCLKATKYTIQILIFKLLL